MNSLAKAAFTSAARSVMRSATPSSPMTPAAFAVSVATRCRGRSSRRQSSPMVGSGFSLVAALGCSQSPKVKPRAPQARGGRTIGPSLIDQTKSTHRTIAGKRLFAAPRGRRSAARASRGRRRSRRPSRSSRRSRDTCSGCSRVGSGETCGIAPSARWSAIMSRSHLRRKSLAVVQVAGGRARRPARRLSSRAARRAAGNRSAPR